MTFRKTLSSALVVAALCFAAPAVEAQQKCVSVEAAVRVMQTKIGPFERAPITIEKAYKLWLQVAGRHHKNFDTAKTAEVWSKQTFSANLVVLFDEAGCALGAFSVSKTEAPDTAA